MFSGLYCNVELEIRSIYLYIDIQIEANKIRIGPINNQRNFGLPIFIHT